ncbi:sulfotransferase 1B1-like [Planococcus citri]|uniref:sulfotransferase 1B1-like n=1 Tax=Planococcus citri TaxID=170843 RepID=UPI0031F72765
MQIKYNNLEEEFRKRLDGLFGVENCLIEVNPGKVLLPPKYQEIGERIFNLKVKDDDLWLISYPRTGSTWAQEMAWCIANNLDYEGAKLLSQFRAPLLELTALFGNDQREWKNALGNSVEQVENTPSPRCIKTHLPWDLLPKELDQVKPKIIYVCRNPKDICVSYYHYCKLIHDFHGTFDDFCGLFLDGKTPVGSIWNHARDFWLKRNDPNVLFLKYEEMKKDHKKSIFQVAKFLDKNYTDEQVDGLVEHLSFSKMRQNPAINLEPILEKMYDSNESRPDPDNKFIRKGQVGDWRNYMSDEISAKFDEMNRQYWSDIGLTFEN